MAIKDCKIMEASMNESGVAAAPDKLEGSAAENKALFDRLVRQVVALRFNALLDALLASTAAGELGIAPIEDMDAATVQAALEGVVKEMREGLESAEQTAQERLKMLTEAIDGKVSLARTAKKGNFPVFADGGELADSLLTPETLQELQSLAAQSAEEAEYYASIAKQVAGGEFVTETELQETAADLEKKDVFIAVKGETTWDEMEAARQAGKQLVLRWDTAEGKHYQCPLYMYDVSGSAAAYIFRHESSTGLVQTYRIDNDGSGGIQWGEKSVRPTPAEHTHTPASIGAAVASHTHTPASIGAAVTKAYAFTLPYTSWTAIGDYVYKVVTVSGVLAEDTPIVDIETGADNAANVQYQNEFGKVFRIVTAANNLIFFATAAPGVSIPVQVKVVR